MIFYPGLDHISDARHFERCCISIKTLKNRKKQVQCPEVLIDSGAFTELAQHGHYRSSISAYANELRRLQVASIVAIKAAVTQDYMCEPFMLKRTGLTVDEHQRLTIERYDGLVAQDLPFPVMPVLQGYLAADYVRHAKAYGERLTPGMWVGVGSVCKRNGKQEQVLEVLCAIHEVMPGLKLHGFGVKATSLKHSGVRHLLASADSMAWSFAARKQGRNAHDWREAARFEATLMQPRRFRSWQQPLPLWRGA